MAPTASTFHVLAEQAGERLDAFLAARLAQTDAPLSREKIKTALKAGAARVNGTTVKRPALVLAEGDEVGFTPPEAASTKLTPATSRGHVYRLLHEDADLLVLDKAAGVTVHPAPSVAEPTLVEYLANDYPALLAPELATQGEPRPGVVHRLDKDTSGLILVALKEPARARLAEDFAERRVAKHYLALVRGLPEPLSGLIDAPMGRHPTQKTKMAVVAKRGRAALSNYTVLATDGAFSLVSVAIHTGRTHQIRVHLSHIGHPILGDGTYGGHPRPEDPPRARLATRQLLHAHTLSFSHPGSGERLTFKAEPPADFTRQCLALGRPRQRLVLTGLPGCGKSALLDYFAAQGLPTFSADAEVKRLYAPGGDGAELLSRRYGRELLREDGSVDGPKLFARMRAEDAVRREVEAMVHPMVRHGLEEFFAAHAERPLAVAEIPLYLETGWRAGQQPSYAELPGEPLRAQARTLVLGLARPRQARFASLNASRGWDEELLATMESWQWPEEKKLAACDLVLDNSGDLAALRSKAGELLRELARRRNDTLRSYLEELGNRLAGLSQSPANQVR